jgi:hypothetical protein
MVQALQQRAHEQLVKDVHALRPEEGAVLALLQHRLEMAAAETGQISARGKPGPRRSASSRRKVG